VKCIKAFHSLRGDKVVFDEATGLMWQRSGLDEFMDIEAAKYWIKKLKQRGENFF
jgi:hypothetical protein